MNMWNPEVPRVVVILVLLVVGWVFIRYVEWKSLYYPAKELEATPDAIGLEYQDVQFISDDGHSLHGWWIPCTNARGTVIHCHGNAGNIGDRLWVAADLHRLGVNVFLFDYRGYGQSKGLTTEKGTYSDARAAYEVVRAKYDDAESPPIIVHGQSLGGAVAVQLALDRPVRGLIAESAFSSAVDMGRHLYPWLPVNLFIRQRFDSISKVGRLTMPKLFAHSPVDDIVPYDQGRKLFEAAAEPKEFCELAYGHNEAGWSNTAEYWRSIERLLDRVLGPQRPAQ